MYCFFFSFRMRHSIKRAELNICPIELEPRVYFLLLFFFFLWCRRFCPHSQNLCVCVCFISVTRRLLSVSRLSPNHNNTQRMQIYSQRRWDIQYLSQPFPYFALCCRCCCGIFQTLVDIWPTRHVCVVVQFSRASARFGTGHNMSSPISISATCKYGSTQVFLFFCCFSFLATDNK